MNQLKDHILILGAGLMQRPAIQSARKLGLKVTVIDANPNAMCIPLADNFEPVDLKDKEKIIEHAHEYKIEFFNERNIKLYEEEF